LPTYGSETELADYKDHKISVDVEGVFRARIGAQQKAEAKSLDALRKMLDKFDNAVLGKVPVWTMTYERDRCVQGHITQVRTLSASYGPPKRHEFRVSWKEGEDQRWQFLPASSLIKNTPANLEKITTHNKMADQVDALKEKMEKLAFGLERYKDEELVRRD
jgi:hypothetical protein